MLFSLLLALSAEATTTTGESRACINNHVSEIPEHSLFLFRLEAALGCSSQV